MKLGLLFVILALTFIFAQAEETLTLRQSLAKNVFTQVKRFPIDRIVKTPKNKTCRKVCNCPREFKPVCGKSGRTHSNQCLALCFKDDVIKQGPCAEKCHINPQIIKKKKCRFAPYKNHGSFRNFCCFFNYNKVTKKSSGRRCAWNGEIRKTEQKVECSWTKRGLGKQRHCCIFIRKSIGKKFTDGKKSCKFIGHKITVNKSSGCIWKTFGKYGKRKYCCEKVKTCLGKACQTHSRRCAFKGDVFVQKLSESCKMSIRGKHCKQSKCCTKRTRCVIKSKSEKKCGVKFGKCRFVGKKFCTKRTTRCSWKAYGTDARRKRCCSYLSVKGNKTDVKCKWSGCAVKSRIQSSCKIVKRDAKTQQTECCTWKQSCKCNMCNNSGKKCRFVGKKITQHVNQKCSWTRVSKIGKRRRCCKVTQSCTGNKCSSRKSCKYVGSTISNSQSTKCQWKKISKNLKRKSCCTISKRCVDGKCKTSKKGCRSVGQILYKVQKNCVMKNHGTHSKRQYCCKKTNKCTGKTCKVVKTKCTFVGKIISQIPKSHCARIPYGIKGTRNNCCKWVEYCEGKKCTPIKKTCSWKGAVLQRYLKTNCKMVKIALGRQKKCCTSVMKCVDKSCKAVTKRCKLVGHIFRIHNLKQCHFKQFGKSSRRKWCCRSTKKCLGDQCKLREGKCGWLGDIYTRKSKNQCTWVKTKNFLRRKCCTWFKSCVNKRCVEGQKICKNLGKPILVSRFNNCKWKVFNKVFRRRFCCKGTRSNDKTKNTKNCSWTGKVLALTKTFWKKQRVCTKTQCCFRLSKCITKGAESSCVFKKTVGCTPTKGKHSLTCTNWGSAHTTPFSTRTFSHYRAGDFVLLQSKKFTCHIRLVQEKVVSTQKIACELNGDKVESTLIPNMFLVNGKDKVTLKKGEVFKLPNGGLLKQFTSRRYILDSNGKGFVEVEKRGNYLTVVARIRHATEFTNGLCVGRKARLSAVGIFSTLYQPKVVQKPATCEDRAKYVKECQAHLKVTSSRRFLVAACAFDRCLGVPVRDFDYNRKFKVYVKELPLLDCKWISSGKPNCVAQQCCTIRKFSKSETQCKISAEKCVSKTVTASLQSHFCKVNGDPHFVSFAGKRFSNYGTGDYVLVAQKSFEVHHSQREWDGTAVTTKFIVRVNNKDIIEVNSQNSQTLNGVKLSLKVGETKKAPNGGQIERKSKRNFVVTAADGSYVDANINAGKGWPQAHYIDLIVFVKQLSETKGLCVDKTQVIASKGMFLNSVKPISRPKPIISKEKMDAQLAVCRKAGVNELNLHACAIDLVISNNRITPQAFLRIIKLKKLDQERFENAKKVSKADTVKLIVKHLQNRVTCELYAGPHAKSFDGKRFEAQTLGDWVLYKGAQLTASYRGEKSTGLVSITQYLVNVNGDIIRNIAFKGISINGEAKTLNEGKTTLPKGGFLKKNGRTLTISTNSGEEVDFINYGTFYNTYVRSNAAHSTGICNKQFIPSTSFKHIQAGKIMKTTLKDCKNRENIQKICQSKKLFGPKLWDCVLDLCNHLPADIEKKIMKDNNIEKRIQLDNKWIQAAKDKAQKRVDAVTLKQQKEKLLKLSTETSTPKRIEAYKKLDTIIKKSEKKKSK